MILVASESVGRTHTLNQVTRELSLNLVCFGSAVTLERLMSGPVRRIVLLNEDDVNDGVIATLTKSDGAGRFGLILSANREALRTSSRASLLDEIAEFTNVEWINPDYDIDCLCHAARECRRRMLRISKHELEQAILERQFLIQYQPKVERSEGTEWITREAEALLRWRHPIHGVLGPLEFLPEVEAFDLSALVGEIVLREAALQLKKWREQGLKLNSCINLASSLLSNPDLPETYAEIIGKYKLECSNFTFEVTERDVANSDAPHLRVLKAFREQGFRISLDDFGVAASSLGTFEQLPFDEIKIHASALRRARENPVALKVLAAVSGLAHSLGMSVCAEGVEDEETFEFLHSIGCDKMQGFLISEAVMPDIIRRVYSARPKETVNVA